jgi:hypothetical protein
MLPGEDGNSETAIIEFNSRDEALVAQTRDQKLIDENTIEVQLGSNSTLFVTNFPPTADEKYIRDLFHEVSAQPTLLLGLLRLTAGSTAKSLISDSPPSSTTRIAGSATCNSRPARLPKMRRSSMGR